MIRLSNIDRSHAQTTEHDARDDLDASTVRRFRSGRACIDFAHTGGVGAWKAAELIHDAATASRWLALCVGTRDVRASRDDVEPLRELREAIWELAQAQIAGRALPERPIAVANEWAAQPSIVRYLTVDGSTTIRTPTGREALAELARDAVDLFGGPLANRLHECAAPDCQLLLVDNSLRGQRRWCSMERCGNRAKARAHRAKQSAP